MALETNRPYFSIGEVLNVLKDSFPDVTVSKIRFLESEGLIQPERTGSGYRKFTETDIERLRFILTLQRDHFLPLKVIRERLDEVDQAPPGAGQSRLAFDAEPAPAAAEDAPATAATTTSMDPRTALAAGSGLSFSPSELAHASGLMLDQIDELTSFRMLNPTQIREQREGEEAGAPVLRYNEHDLEAAKLCRALLEMGLEPRHLRAFRTSADRWADIAELVSNPLARQRHPEARKQAEERIREVIRVGTKLVRVLLRETVGPVG
jgi:DNA-binding transcriptional MerR regulator